MQRGPFFGVKYGPGHPLYDAQLANAREFNRKKREEWIAANATAEEGLILRQMVADYTACTLFVVGSSFVNPAVLLEMVKWGWRKSESDIGGDRAEHPAGLDNGSQVRSQDSPDAGADARTGINKVQ